jgi:hypothetical protein
MMHRSPSLAGQADEDLGANSESLSGIHDRADAGSELRWVVAPSCAVAKAPMAKAVTSHSLSKVAFCRAGHWDHEFRGSRLPSEQEINAVFSTSSRQKMYGKWFFFITPHWISAYSH